jgi:hypothetical protein
MLITRQLFNLWHNRTYIMDSIFCYYWRKKKRYIAFFWVFCCKFCEAAMKIQDKFSLCLIYQCASKTHERVEACLRDCSVSALGTFRWSGTLQRLFYHRANWGSNLWTVDGCATDRSLFSSEYKKFFLPWLLENLNGTLHIHVKHVLKVPEDKI